MFTTKVPARISTGPVKESGTSKVSVPLPAFWNLPAPRTSPSWKASVPAKAEVVGALSVIVFVSSSMATMVPNRPA